MRFTHFLIAMLVIFIWGFNFLFIKFGLEDLPPLLFCAVRFFLASFPAIFFFKLPKNMPFKWIAWYGVFMFGLQFSLMFTSMKVGMTPGVASVLLQTQVFFSLIFAVFFLKQPLHIWQISGALLAFSGICIVGFHLDQNVSLLGFIMVIAAAASWGLGNLIATKIKNINVLALVVWGSLVAFFVTSSFSLALEGPALIVESLQHISWLGVISVCYVVYLSTWVAYGAWNWLIRQYPLATVAPFTLLIPVVAMLSSTIVTGEPMDAWKILVAALVISGLLINLLGTRLFIKPIKKDFLHHEPAAPMSDKD